MRPLAAALALAVLAAAGTDARADDFAGRGRQAATRSHDNFTGDLRFGERTELHGRFGLRYQGELEAPEGDDSIHRARLDARVGVSVRAVHWAYAVLRVRAATSGADPRDGLLEIGDALDTASLAIDRAHLRLAWDRLPELQIDAGIVDHPIAKAAPLAWDPDLAPSGIAARYDRRLRSIPLAVRPAGFAYLLRSDAEGSPASMFGGQLAATLSQPRFDLELAGSITGFDGATPLAVDNTTDDFLLLGASTSLELHLLYWLPLELSGALIANTRGGPGERLAWSARVTAGRRDWPGDFDVTYRYRDLDLDAVPAALPADDYRIATGVRGHDLVAVYQIAERLTAGASAFVFREKTSGAGVETVLRADLTMRY